MKKIVPLMAAVLIFAACTKRNEPAASSPLPSNVVARINGTDIPAEWFKHEFRSSFFKHMQKNDVRDATFEPFLKRMILAQEARERGIADRPEIRDEIARRIAGMRAYMEYQLAMTEIGILNQALVDELGLAGQPEDVTDAELEAFFERNIKGEPGAPESVNQLPPQAVPGIKRQIAMQRTEAKLDALVEEWRRRMSIEINSDAVQSVPIPEIKGQPPVDF